MMALLWKDYRVNRLVLIVGAVLLFGPYLVATVYALCSERGPGTWAAILSATTDYSLALSLLTIAMLGANAIACERADRSAEFLAYLPPSRAMIIASKSMLAIGGVLVIWGFNLLIIYGVIPAFKDHAALQVVGHVPLWGLAVTSMVLFGAGWLASSFLDSPAIGIGVAFAVPVLVAGVYLSSAALLGWPASESTQDWYCASCLTLGPLCFVAGCVYYVRRVEP